RTGLEGHVAALVVDLSLQHLSVAPEAASQLTGGLVLGGLQPHQGSSSPGFSNCGPRGWSPGQGPVLGKSPRGFLMTPARRPSSSCVHGWSRDIGESRGQPTAERHGSSSSNGGSHCPRSPGPCRVQWMFMGSQEAHLHALTIGQQTASLGRKDVGTGYRGSGRRGILEGFYSEEGFPGYCSCFLVAEGTTDPASPQ
ncbi:hypothetical protein KUCAC02_002801, partial [Chaenocephalus aceratus]